MTEEFNKNPNLDEMTEAELQEWLAQQYKADYKRLMTEAIALLQKGEGKEAAQKLEPIYRQEPDNVDVLVNLSSAYIMGHAYKKAQELLEHATTLVPEDPGVWSNLAAAYLGTLVLSTTEKQDRALAAYQKVLAIDEKYPNTYYNIGLIYFDRREWAKSDEAFVNALRVDPRDKDAQIWRRRIAQKLESEAQRNKTNQTDSQNPSASLN